MVSIADPAGDGPAPRASVIIPHYQMPDALRHCLDSVIVQTLDRGDIEIIVVDNNSRRFPDDVAADYPRVRFLREPTPGPGLARNTGVVAARANVLVFIDADCWAESGWLQAAIDAVEPDPARNVVGGDVRIGFGEPKRLTPLEAYEAVFAYRQRFYIEKRRFSGTGNLAMGRPVYDAVGPFAGINTAEDQDWGRRAFAAGYVTRYVPAMRIYHPARTTMDELQRKWLRHISHELHDHRAVARPMWRWALTAGAVALSIPVHGVRMFTSDRLHGLSNRLAGLGVLARIRIFRAVEMLRAARSPQISGGHFWTLN